MTGGPTAHYLDGDQNGRLHLQHGPIDLIVGVDGAISLELERYFRQHAFALAHRRFQTILQELVAELPLLKSRARVDCTEPKGATARRMMAAVRPYAETHFVTPMAAVAGAVADEVLAAMLAGFPADQHPARIYVNNGGDIALHLDHGAEFRIGMAREGGAALGAFAVEASHPTRGIATSGRGGRSLSMGIADSVTVLARNAAEADAAASLVGNAVDLPGHPAVRRARAVDVVDDSDLGEHLVVTGCGDLGRKECEAALASGAAEAERFIAAGLIHRAGLFLGDCGRIVDGVAADDNTSALEKRRYA
jgi:ApbE superfamily uncharacterized protein (UPF0280 family)